MSEVIPWLGLLVEGAVCGVLSGRGGVGLDASGGPVSLRRTTGKAVGDGELTFGDGIAWECYLSDIWKDTGVMLESFGTKVD